MCCFSGSVRRVSQTNIFARRAGDARQILVYAMRLAADVDLAMILPLPVPASPPEDAVRFIDLHRYPTFFGDLSKAFRRGAAIRSAPKRETPLAAATLKVHEVGDFEASFVPRVADFSRVDPRFRLPDQVWGKLPLYADYGFAVFKLRTGAAEPGATKAIHPMAFDFPVRDPSRLFFPTLHIHDGEVHPTAAFDHWLYFQGDMAVYEAASFPVRKVVDVRRAAGVVDPDAPLRRTRISGEFTNADTYVRLRA